MIPNHSPWINQLRRTRPVMPLAKDVSAAVAIVGGGIAGVVTAFFTLRDTDKSVVLIEADKIAHGATGHNAGQVTSYFERPLLELVQEFGLELATEGQRSVESAWGLLDTIISEAKMQTPLYRFTGYTGYTTRERLLEALENNWYRVQGNLPTESIIVSAKWPELATIPEKYKDFYHTAPHSTVLALLETKNHDYFAALGYPKGCMNSALFTEELIGYLIVTYPERFSFYEGSPVKTLSLFEQRAELKVLEHTVTADRVVLCTNGFENFTIKNYNGIEIDTSFHHAVTGRIGYMAAYYEEFRHPPTAVSYYPKQGHHTDPTGENYFYLTRRPFEHEGKEERNLVCTGGPETVLPNGAIYSRHHEHSEDMRDTIDAFLRHNYGRFPAETEYAFSWHGLMGYTPSGVRRVGPEPCNPILLYNLGCNGVGILPSVFGGKRIGQFISGQKMAPSLFDLHDQRLAVEATETVSIK